LHRLSNKEIVLKSRVRGLLLFFGSLLAIVIAALPLVGIYKDKLVRLIDDPFAVGNLQANVPWSYAECAWGIIYLIGIWVAVAMMKKNFQRGMIVLCVLQLVIIEVTVLHFTPKIEAISQRAAIEYFESFKDKDVYVHPLGYKSYAHLFYTDKKPSLNPNYTIKGGVDSAGNSYPPKVNEQWLLTGKLDKPAYFICKIMDEKKYDTMPQLQKTGSKNGFVFYMRK
jgi:hypothetical protein